MLVDMPWDGISTSTLRVHRLADFLYFPLTASTTVVARELLENGKVYWTFVGYALMPKYAQTIETKEKMIVPVVDISADPTLRTVAHWLKEQKE